MTVDKIAERVNDRAGDSRILSMLLHSATIRGVSDRNPASKSLCSRAFIRFPLFAE